MHVTYDPTDPADGEPAEWDIDLRRIRQSEAERIEKAFGGTKDQWDGAILTGDSKARKVLLWHLMRREHPNMPLAAVPDFYTGELTVDLSLDDLRRLRKQLEQAPLTPDEKTDILERIDAEILQKTGAADVIDGETVEPGKAVTKTRPAATG